MSASRAQPRRNSACGCSVGTSNSSAVRCSSSVSASIRTRSILRLFAAIDRQHPVRRNLAELLLIFEVIAEFLPLLLGDLGLCADEFSRAFDDSSQPLPQLRPLAEVLGKDVADTQERVGRRRDLMIRVNKILCATIEVGW